MATRQNEETFAFWTPNVVAALGAVTLILSSCGSKHPTVDERIEVADVNARRAIVQAGEAKEAAEDASSDADELRSQIEELESRIEELESKLDR